MNVKKLNGLEHNSDLCRTQNKRIIFSIRLSLKNMTPRKRNKKNQDLAGLNLYLEERNGIIYYRYRNKRAWVTGELKSVSVIIGNSNEQSEQYITRQEAKATAAILQDKFRTPIADALAEKLGRLKSRSTESVLGEFYSQYLPTLNRSPSTIENYKTNFDKMKRQFGNKPFPLTVGQVNDYLKTLTEHAYIKHRAQLCKVYDWAISQGYCPVGQNNAAATLKKAEPRRQRPRIQTWAQYQAIYNQADEWLQIAMDFCLISLQPRQVAVEVTHDMLQQGKIRVVRTKSMDHLEIQVGPSLLAVIERSRRTAVPSPYVIHRKPIKRQRSNSHWTAVAPDYLTRAFTQAVRKTGLWGNSHPTLHELRSFGKQLYKAQGLETQDLMGHEDDRMQARYDRDHVEWKKCIAGLDVTDLKK